MMDKRKTFEEVCAGILPQKTIDDIFREYERPERHYHNIHHLITMSEILFEFKDLISSYDACIIACLYHDVVYDTKSKKNEELSEQKSRKDLTDIYYDPSIIETVSSLILSTKKHIPSVDDFDHRIFLDSDLSILGTPMRSYQDYMNNIRKEYSWVKENDYRIGRGEILRKFLQRESIYFTPQMKERLEEQARNNIEHELKMLAIESR
jgi:predicted metal-dependent HD superfamily phosphohydrolase